MNGPTAVAELGIDANIYSDGLRAGEEMQRIALQQQEWTASDADITPHSVNEYAIKHKPVSIHQTHVENITKEKAPSLKRVLDGFHILEAAGAQLPTDVRQVVFVDKGLVNVVEEDLRHFDKLVLLDVSENHLEFIMLASIPRLKALNMACNQIKVIEKSYGFDRLQILDLSYNSLTLRSVQNLDFLPELKELDLCGNNLKGLPMEMYRFRTLEKILLDNNKIDDNNVFSILCTMQNLRQASVAYNFLHNIPEQCCGEGYFPLLTMIDLSFNYFGTEDDVMSLVDLPRLDHIICYGNPMCGPKGEDPLYTYIEDLHIACTDTRIERRMPRIEMTTEIPRKRNFKKLKGRAAGRHASYRDFSIVKVGGDFDDESGAVKTNNDWREEGNRTLFAEAIAQAQAEKLMSSIPDSTFITATAANDDDAKILRMADKVMDNVAADLNLATSAEILYFQDRTKLRTNDFSNVEIPQGNSLEMEALELEMQEDEDTRWLNTFQEDNEDDDDDRIMANDANKLQHSSKPQDKVPPGMFSRTMADPSTLQTHPVAVKTAMRALNFAIKHPLTNYHEVPAKGGLPPKDYVRETHASLNRKMPRQEASMKPQSDISKIKNKAMRGLGEPSIVAAARKRKNDETLIQIEDVLDKLNSNADELALKGTGNANTRDGIDTMKHFARPQTGLRGLVKMVDEVVRDLDK
jgi:hypothetical protein